MINDRCKYYIFKKNAIQNIENSFEIYYDYMVHTLLITAIIMIISN